MTCFFAVVVSVAERQDIVVVAENNLRTHAEQKPQFFLNFDQQWVRGWREEIKKGLSKTKLDFWIGGFNKIVTHVVAAANIPSICEECSLGRSTVTKLIVDLSRTNWSGQIVVCSRLIIVIRRRTLLCSRTISVWGKRNRCKFSAPKMTSVAESPKPQSSPSRSPTGAGSSGSGPSAAGQTSGKTVTASSAKFLPHQGSSRSVL